MLKLYKGHINICDINICTQKRWGLGERVGEYSEP